MEKEDRVLFFFRDRREKRRMNLLHTKFNQGHELVKKKKEGERNDTRGTVYK